MFADHEAPTVDARNRRLTWKLISGLVVLGAAAIAVSLTQSVDWPGSRKHPAPAFITVHEACGLVPDELEGV